MARPIRLDLDQERLTLGPGETARLGLTLRNTSDVVEHLHVEVRGLPPGGRATSEPRTVKLLPSAVAECTLTLELPSTPLPPAGEHVLGVLARSPHRREVSRCEEVRLDVPAQAALGLEVEPELVRAGPRAQYSVTLSNGGNVRLVVGLAGTDPERQVRLDATPERVALPAGGTAHVQVTASAPRPWTGQDKRRPVTLTAAAGATTASRTVAFVQPPRLRPVALRSVTGLLALSVVGAALALTGRLPVPGGGPAPAPATSSGADGTPAPATAEPTTAPSAPPSDPGTASSEPTASSPPSEEPSPSPTPTPTTAPSPTGPAPSPVRVPFTDGGTGAEPRLVDGDDLWREAGVTVAAAPDAGTSPGCASADAVAVHPGGDDPFVTAATTDPAACNAVGMRVTFVGDRAPVRDVSLEVVVDGDYRVAFDDEPAVARRSAQRIVSIDTDEQVSSVTIATVPATGGAPQQVGLTRVLFTPSG